MWWLPCEDANVLLAAFEQLAIAVDVDIRAVRQTAGANHSAYRRALVTLVYGKLDERQQGSLLVMDNAADAEVLSDFLQAWPQNTRVAITTRSSTLFAGLYP